jgi:aspartate-semialdehyde dehydrogenase
VEKTIVYGVNHQDLTADDLVISNASCTTNCLAPVAKVLTELCGIERGYMTTIHSYTNDQPSLDQMHKDLYRARGAGQSMIPTSTGAAKALGLVIPALKGKLDGSSIRVPTPNVSVVDFKFVPGRDVTVQEINAAFTAARPATARSTACWPSPRSRWSPSTSTTSRQRHRRPAPDPGDRRPPRPRPRLVRQRVGLLDPHGRHRAGDGQASVNARDMVKAAVTYVRS